MLRNLASFVTILLAVSYHVFFRNFLFTFLGVGRSLRQIQEFPYTCHRLEHQFLSSCEDLWLDEDNRTLYAACSDLSSRTQWLPAANKFNASGRRKTDHFSALDIDHPGEDGLYRLRRLEVTGPYQGINPENKNVLDLHGFGVRKLSQSRLQFFVVNHRPPTTPGGLLEQNVGAVGDNSTIEVFELERGSSKLEFLKTIMDKSLISPNDLAWVAEGYMLITNDHLTKAGKLHDLQSYYGSGNLIACDLGPGNCHPVIAHGLRYANGVVQGHDGLIYISEFITGTISAYRFSSEGVIVFVDTINLRMPIDNLYIDSAGSVWAPGVPKANPMFRAVETGERMDIPSTIFRIRNRGDSMAPRFDVQKVLEDGAGLVLPGSTAVVHDVRTGKLFMGGVGSPFIAVCTPK
ncbi:calcium-dependent phosphotriesterase [Aspergillus pseudoustus]|uniref:Calcium-dependent phosphotriesterase n=1 Tax=Aspergillus pseudoustus TaxID=1810923 RepID=A0ABR4L284_9EURO